MKQARETAERLCAVPHHRACSTSDGLECDCFKSSYTSHVLARAFLSLARQLAEAKRENERMLYALVRIEATAQGCVQRIAEVGEPPSHWSGTQLDPERVRDLARAALNTDDCQQSPPKDSGESSTDRATTGVEGASE